MFHQTFVEVPGQPVRKPYTIFASMLLQIGVLCVLILIPLFYTQVLPNAQLKSILMAPPPPVNPPRPPVTTTIEHAPAARVFQLSKLTAPVAIPKSIPKISDAPAVPDISGAVSAEGNMSPGNPLLFSSPGTAPPAPAPPATVAKPKPSGPMRVGGSVAEANIIHRVDPIYPALAKSARIQGTVEFTAVISKDGLVENLKLVSGHPLLVSAARDAILQWRYRPTLLNGQPVEVVTTITVNFRLSM